MLSVKDTLDWKIEDGRIIVSSMQTHFLERKNSIHTGPGDIAKDIQMARMNRADKYK